MPGKDSTVATQDATEGVVARPSDSFAQYLMRLASENTTNRSFDVASSQLDRMLSAESVDDIMDSDEQGTVQTRDLVGLEMDVPAFDFRTSIHKSDDKYNSPLGVYIQFPAIALNTLPERGISVGDELLVSSGAPLIIGKLRTMAAGGFLPYKFLIAGIAGPNGTVLKLRRVPARA